MNKPRNDSTDVALWTFLDELRESLRAVREDQNALRLSLSVARVNISKSTMGASLWLHRMARAQSCSR
jgi:hypothetical protein